MNNDELFIRGSSPLATYLTDLRSQRSGQSPQSEAPPLSDYIPEASAQWGLGRHATRVWRGLPALPAALARWLPLNGSRRQHPSHVPHRPLDAALFSDPDHPSRDALPSGHLLAAAGILHNHSYRYDHASINGSSTTTEGAARHTHVRGSPCLRSHHSHPCASADDASTCPCAGADGAGVRAIVRALEVSGLLLPLPLPAGHDGIEGSGSGLTVLLDAGQGPCCHASPWGQGTMPGGKGRHVEEGVACDGGMDEADIPDRPTEGLSSCPPAVCPHCGDSPEHGLDCTACVCWSRTEHGCCAASTSDGVAERKGASHHTLPSDTPAAAGIPLQRHRLAVVAAGGCLVMSYLLSAPLHMARTPPGGAPGAMRRLLMLGGGHTSSGATGPVRAGSSPTSTGQAASPQPAPLPPQHHNASIQQGKATACDIDATTRYLLGAVTACVLAWGTWRGLQAMWRRTCADSIDGTHRQRARQRQQQDGHPHHPQLEGGQAPGPWPSTDYSGAQGSAGTRERMTCAAAASVILPNDGMPVLGRDDGSGATSHASKATDGDAASSPLLVSLASPPPAQHLGTLASWCTARLAALAGGLVPSRGGASTGGRGQSSDVVCRGTEDTCTVHMVTDGASQPPAGHTCGQRGSCRLALARTGTSPLLASALRRLSYVVDEAARMDGLVARAIATIEDTELLSRGYGLAARGSGATAGGGSAVAYSGTRPPITRIDSTARRPHLRFQGASQVATRVVASSAHEAAGIGQAQAAPQAAGLKGNGRGAGIGGAGGADKPAPATCVGRRSSKELRRMLRSCLLACEGALARLASARCTGAERTMAAPAMCPHGPTADHRMALELSTLQAQGTATVCCCPAPGEACVRGCAAGRGTALAVQRRCLPAVAAASCCHREACTWQRLRVGDCEGEADGPTGVPTLRQLKRLRCRLGATRAAFFTDLASALLLASAPSGSGLPGADPMGHAGAPLCLHKIATLASAPAASTASFWSCPGEDGRQPSCMAADNANVDGLPSCGGSTCACLAHHHHHASNGRTDDNMGPEPARWAQPTWPARLLASMVAGVSMPAKRVQGYLGLGERVAGVTCTSTRVGRSPHDPDCRHRATAHVPLHHARRVLAAVEAELVPTWASAREALSRALTMGQVMVPTQHASASLQTHGAGVAMQGGGTLELLQGATPAVAPVRSSAPPVVAPATGTCSGASCAPVVAATSINAVEQLAALRRALCHADAALFLLQQDAMRWGGRPNGGGEKEGGSCVGSRGTAGASEAQGSTCVGTVQDQTCGMGDGGNEQPGGGGADKGCTVERGAATALSTQRPGTPGGESDCQGDAGCPPGVATQAPDRAGSLAKPHDHPTDACVSSQADSAGPVGAGNRQLADVSVMSVGTDKAVEADASLPVISNCCPLSVARVSDALPLRSESCPVPEAVLGAGGVRQDAECPGCDDCLRPQVARCRASFQETLGRLGHLWDEAEHTLGTLLSGRSQEGPWDRGVGGGGGLLDAGNIMGEEQEYVSLHKDVHDGAGLAASGQGSGNEQGQGSCAGDDGSDDGSSVVWGWYEAAGPTIGDGVASCVGDASNMQRVVGMAAAASVGASTSMAATEECFVVEIPEDDDDYDDDVGLNTGCIPGRVAKSNREQTGGCVPSLVGEGKLTRAQRIAAKKAAQLAAATNAAGIKRGVAAADQAGKPRVQAVQLGANAHLLMVKELKDVLGVKYCRGG